LTGFDSEQSELIKEVLKIKLMQLRAGFGDQLHKDMDENTYTSTIISSDFELLKMYFPNIFI